MRYAPEHKQATRQRLVAEGGRHAKAHGFGDSGMAALAEAAGVTTGSLYKHFDGKSELFAAVVRAELQRTTDLFAGADAAAAAHVMVAYLSMDHVQHPEAGCALPALTPEIARAEAPVREAFAEGLRAVHEQVSRFTTSPEAAWSAIAQNVGAVMLARALPDEAMQRELLSALRRSGRALLKEPG